MRGRKHARRRADRSIPRLNRRHCPSTERHRPYSDCDPERAPLAPELILGWGCRKVRVGCRRAAVSGVSPVFSRVRGPNSRRDHRSEPYQPSQRSPALAHLDSFSPTPITDPHVLRVSYPARSGGRGETRGAFGAKPRPRRSGPARLVGTQGGVRHAGAVVISPPPTRRAPAQSAWARASARAVPPCPHAGPNPPTHRSTRSRSSQASGRWWPCCPSRDLARGAYGSSGVPEGAA